VKSVRDTRQSLSKTFSDKYSEETLEAKREAIRKNRSKTLQDRMLEIKEFNADVASKTSMIELGRSIMARCAQAVVGEQLAGLWQYGWVPSLGELEKDIFEALQTDCQTTLATLVWMEAEDDAASLLSEATTAPEASSQKSKKSGKGKKKNKKTRAALVAEAGPSEDFTPEPTAAPQETLSPTEDLAARLASDGRYQGCNSLPEFVGVWNGWLSLSSPSAGVHRDTKLTLTCSRPNWPN
jgi:hypothetical protein